MDTFGDSPILDTAYGGTDLAAGTWNAEQLNGWTVLEWTRSTNPFIRLAETISNISVVMNKTDNFADASLTSPPTGGTYQRVAWSYDAIDVTTPSNVPEHIAYGLINLDFQTSGGGATVPDSPSDIWFTNITSNSFVVNWNTPSVNQAISMGLMKYWQVVITHAGTAACPTNSVNYEDGANCYVQCTSCVAAPSATSMLINTSIWQTRCSALAGCAQWSVAPSQAAINPNTRYYISMAGFNTRGFRSTFGPFFSVSTTRSSNTYPGLATNMRVTARTNTDLTIAWDAPADDGGSAITDYEIICDSGGGLHAPYSLYYNITVGSNTPTATFTNLVDGTYTTMGTFRFRVRAKNAIGWGLFTSDNFGDKGAWNIFTMYPLPGSPVAPPVPIAPPVAPAPTKPAAPSGGGAAPSGGGVAPKAAPSGNVGPGAPSGPAGSPPQVILPPSNPSLCPDGCFYGSCIAADTCQCSAGWSGSSCNTTTAGTPTTKSTAPVAASPPSGSARITPASAARTTVASAVSLTFLFAALTLAGLSLTS